MSFIIYTKEQAANFDAERNAAFEKKHGRPMTYEDVIESFGGRFVGCSMVKPHQAHGRTVLVENL